jgi:hypothetical protein
MRGNERFRSMANMGPEEGHKELHEKLLAALREDPELTDTTNISITIGDTALSGKKKIEIFGKLNNEREKSRAEEIIRLKTDKDSAIINNIKVDPAFNTP